jgi:hypothetical protein
MLLSLRFLRLLLSFLPVLRMDTDATVVVRSSHAYVKRHSRRYLLKTIRTLDTMVNGRIQRPVSRFKPGVHTVYPDSMLAEDVWMRHFKVSYMVGWRSEPVHIDNINAPKQRI